MLTPHDELLCHQLPTTFDHVSQSDLRWTERIVMYGFDRSGDINVMTGLARYPNRNVTDAYVMITRRDRRRRSGSPRGADVDRDQPASRDRWAPTPSGRSRYRVEEPLRTVRAVL